MVVVVPDKKVPDIQNPTIEDMSEQPRKIKIMLPVCISE